jgi:hypothetical protein
MDTSTIEIVAREPFDANHQAFSGATFERGFLADGRPVVVKHLPAEGDWITAVSDGLGRARRLWDDGILADIAATVDHAVIGLVREDGHDVVVMDDVSDLLLPTNDRIRPAHVDRILDGMADLHTRWEGTHVAGLCSPARRIGLFTPRFHATYEGPHHFVQAELVGPMWAVFDTAVPDEVAAAIAEVHAEPAGLETAMRTAGPWTLLHGDLKSNNLGVRGDRLVVLDWGELTGVGPAAMDLVWFAGMSTVTHRGHAVPQIDVLPDELFAAYERRAGRRLDPISLDLACIGFLAQFGFWLAAVGVSERTEPGDPARTRAALLLDWWVDRVRQALPSWSGA